MKRILAMMLASVSCVAMLAGCGNSAQTETVAETAEAVVEQAATETAEAVEAPAENVKVDKLTIGFVPSRDPDEIVTATEPLKELLTTELAGLGYEVGEVDITVGTSYEAVGEGLSDERVDEDDTGGGEGVQELVQRDQHHAEYEQDDVESGKCVLGKYLPVRLRFLLDGGVDLSALHPLADLLFGESLDIDHTTCMRTHIKYCRPSRCL